MARLRYNGLATTLGADLTSTDTSIAFSAALTHAGGTAVPNITGSDYIPLTILDGSGAASEIVSLTAYTAGSTTGTIARAVESTTAVAHTSGVGIVHSPTVADFTSSASGGGVLGSVAYTPGTQAAYSTTSTTLVDVDATNLAVSFTAPASGAVLVRLEAVRSMSAASTAEFWGLREGSSTVAVTEVAYNFTSSLRLSVTMKVSGLASGSTHTYKWAWLRGTGSGTLNLYAGGADGVGAGSAIMQVSAA